MRAAIYCRVSTTGQRDDGLSLEVQESRCRAYAEARGWRVDGVYQDGGYSGKSLSRPQLQRLLDHAKAGKFEACVCWKLDRLTRSVADLGTVITFFDKRKIPLCFVEDSLDFSTAHGRLTATILAAVSAWEREAAGERTRDGLAYRRDHGLVYGPIPFGFRQEGDRLVPNEAELKVVKKISALRREGKTLQAICDALNRQRIPTKTGKKWRPGTLTYLLKNTDLYGPSLK